ncbi:hypothetical protein [Microbulbifer sp. ZKSA002]
MAESIPEGADLDVRSEIGHPPSIESLHFNLQGAGEEGVYILSVYEGLEYYLGSESFDGLEERFSAIDGVSGAEHADREIFVVYSQSLSLDDLRSKLWTVLLSAASESFPGA